MYQRLSWRAKTSDLESGEEVRRISQDGAFQCHSSLGTLTSAAWRSASGASIEATSRQAPRFWRKESLPKSVFQHIPRFKVLRSSRDPC